MYRLLIKCSATFIFLYFIYAGNAFSQGAFLGKWAGMYGYYTKKGKLIPINKWVLELDNITEEGIAGNLYEYFPEDAEKPYEDRVYTKLSKGGKQPLMLDHKPLTTTVSMKGSTFYRADFSKRCNGSWTGELSLDWQKNVDTIRFKFEADLKNCAIDAIVILTRIQRAVNPLASQPSSLIGSWRENRENRQASHVAISEYGAIQWTIKNRENNAGLELTEIISPLAGNKDSIFTSAIQPAVSNGAFIFQTPSSANCNFPSKAFLYKRNEQWEMDVFSQGAGPGCSLTALHLIKSVAAPATTVSPEVTPSAVKLLQPGAYQLIKNSPIDGEQTFQFVITPQKDKLEFRYGSLNRELCDISFEGSAHSDTPGIFTFNEPAYPLSFTLTLSNNGFVISNVKANKDDECGMYPEEGFYKPSSVNTKVWGYVAAVKAPQPKEKAQVQSKAVPSKPGALEIPKGPISATPRTAMVKRWKVTGNANPSMHQDILNDWKKGKGTEFQFLGNGDFFAYKDGVISISGKYVVAPDNKSFLIKYTEKEQVPCRILRLTSEEFVFEALIPEGYGQKKSVMFLSAAK